MPYQNLFRFNVVETEVLNQEQSDALNVLEGKVPYLDFWNAPRPLGKAKIMAPKEKMGELSMFLQEKNIKFRNMEGTVQE